MDRFQNTRLPDVDWWARLWPTPGETLRELGVKPGDTVVEIGCGNGFFALPAARIVAPATVYALDIDTELLGDLEAWTDEQGIENVVPIAGDARELSALLPEPVDVALFANALHGVEDPDRFLEQVDESLTPGGRFVVVNWHARPREETMLLGEPRGPPSDLRLTPEETEAIGTAGGFSVLRTVELPPHHYAVVFER